MKLMQRTQILAVTFIGFLAVMVPAARAQYIGYVYPAGGQQGTTFKITLGGQGLEGVNGIFVSGSGVKVRVVEYNKKMNPQEVQLLGEQLRELKDPAMHKPEEGLTNLIARIEKLVRENVIQPQSASIANLVIAEVTMASDARPGLREIRLGTPRGISNPLVFNVGQLPEIAQPPAVTSTLQILGKEEQSLRRKKRDKAAQGGMEMMMATTMMMGGPGAQSDLDEDEVAITLPCTLNGQISSGAVDRFRFSARKGQRVVIRAQARELVPYMADAVPGWFQAVLLLCDSKGREVAYDDDYRFKPDPVVLYEIPEDGEYMFAIYDAIYRGREDFVYRITIGELPFVTSIFPLGCREGSSTALEVKGWNLLETRLIPDVKDKAPGVYSFSTPGKDGFVSNPFSFALDTLPEYLEKEPNSQRRTAQSVSLPVIVNGHVDHPGDHDYFQFEGKTGDRVVAEVYARRLDSPVDSVLKLLDAAGKCIAINDDREDAGTGLNTHHADSYISATLPTNGIFYIQLGDTQHRGGDEYGYRLRISAPQPDFALRVVPSYVAIRSNSTAALRVYAVRQDGFTNTIKFALKGDTNQFSATGSMTGTQAMTTVTVKTYLAETKEPVSLIIEGSSTNGNRKIVHQAGPAEDRMQAFLWRHLVPVRELTAFVFNPPPPPKPEPKKAEPKKAEPKKEEPKKEEPKKAKAPKNDVKKPESAKKPVPTEKADKPEPPKPPAPQAAAKP